MFASCVGKLRRIDAYRLDEKVEISIAECLKILLPTGCNYSLRRWLGIHMTLRVPSTTWRAPRYHNYVENDNHFLSESSISNREPIESIGKHSYPTVYLF
jgi:hypothetical protein